MNIITLFLVLVAASISMTFNSFATIETFPLNVMSSVDIVKLECNESEHTINLPISKRWQINQADLKLNFKNSSAIIPNNSLIVIKINDNPVSQINMDPKNTDNEVLIAIPPETIINGENELKFHVTQHYTLDCETPCASELWTALELNKSAIIFDYDLKPIPLKLTDALEYIFDENDLSTSHINIITEKQNDDYILFASYIASGISMRDGESDTIIHYSDQIIPDIDNIVIGNREFVEIVSGTHIQDLDGPTIKLIQSSANNKPKTIPPFEQVRNNNIEQDVLLVFTGNSIEDLRSATLAFANINYPIPNSYSHTIKNNSTTLQPAEPYTGKLMLRSGESYLIENLDFTDITLRGNNPGSREIVFRLPSDLLIKSNKLAGLSMNLAYGAGMRSDSVLNIYINDIFISGIPFNQIEGGLLTDYEVPIPAYLLQNGTNKIRFEPILVPSVSSYCEHQQSENLHVSIFDNSSIYIPSMPHWAEMPNMKYFFEDGFPFTRWPDARNTTILLTNNDHNTIAATLNFVALMTDRIGYPLTQLNVTNDKNKIVDEEIIIIGQNDLLPDELIKRVKLTKESDSLIPKEESGTLDKLKEYLLEIKNLLSDIDNQNYATADTLTSPSTKDLIEDLESEQGAVMLIESPSKIGRSVLVMTAISSDDLLTLSRKLLDESINHNISGGFSLIDLNEGTLVANLTTSVSYRTGNLGNTNSFQYYMNTNIWLYVFVLAFAIIVLALITIKTLHKFRTRRVSTDD